LLEHAGDTLLLAIVQRAAQALTGLGKAELNARLLVLR